MSAKNPILKNLFNNEEDKQILFNQYQLYVEMANEVSTRRHDMNKFYVTLISLFITIFSIIISITHELVLFIIPLVFIIVICSIWKINIKSYRELNRVKFDIINEIETKLPAKGFTIESNLLESSNYNEFTKVEGSVPIIIILLAVIAIIILLLIQKGYCIF